MVQNLIIASQQIGQILTYEWMNEWMSEWMNEWMNEWTSIAQPREIQSTNTESRNDTPNW